MPPVIALNVLVLGPLALWAIYGLAARIAGRAFGLARRRGLGRAAVRGDPALARRLSRALRRAVPPGRARTDGARRLPVDGAPARRRVCSSCGRSRPRAALDAVAAGLVVGFAVGVKPSNGLFLAAPVAAALLARNLRPLLPFGLALLPALLTLALSGSSAGSARCRRSRSRRRGSRRRVVAVTCPWSTGTSTSTGRTCMTTPTTCASTSGARALLEWRADRRRLRRRAPLAAAGGAAGDLVRRHSSSSRERRRCRPSRPAASSASSCPASRPTSCSASRLCCSCRRSARDSRAAGRRSRARPLDRRLVFGLGVALALVPLVVVALVRPIESPAKAVARRRDPHPGRQGDRRRRPRGRRGARPHLDAPAGRLERRLLPRLPHRPRPAPTSSAPTTAARRSAICRWCCSGRRASGAGATDHRPRLRYRIGVAANSSNDPTAGDVATISEPIEAP